MSIHTYPFPPYSMAYVSNNSSSVLFVVCPLPSVHHKGNFWLYRHMFYILLCPCDDISCFITLILCDLLQSLKLCTITMPRVHGPRSLYCTATVNPVERHREFCEYLYSYQNLFTFVSRQYIDHHHIRIVCRVWLSMALDLSLVC